MPEEFTTKNKQRDALIVGATGITGSNLAVYLAANGWQVHGLARNPNKIAGVQPISADLQNAEMLRTALSGFDISHVFVCTWLRQNTEKENVKVNGAMMDNLFAALEPSKSIQHTALVTGTKHYLGPFEAYGQTGAETPFRESTPRLPGENFYYTQENILFAAAERQGFTWSVHRPHTVIGFALGNAMNMGVTLAVYASICRETGQAFIFPGSHLQWNALTDVTDARLLAQQLEWAALTPAAHNQAFNIVNGDVFRWRWLWPQLAAYFGVESVPPPEPIAPLAPRMQNIGPAWAGIAARYGLVENRVERLASWWHTDGDLGRQLECVNDMSKSRLFGFTNHQDTPDSFFHLFDLLRQSRIIPA